MHSYRRLSVSASVLRSIPPLPLVGRCCRLGSTATATTDGVLAAHRVIGRPYSSAPPPTAPAPFPSHYMQNTIVLDTRDLSTDPANDPTSLTDPMQAESLDKRTAQVALELHAWATNAAASLTSAETLADAPPLPANPGSSATPSVAPVLLDNLHSVLLDNARQGRAQVVDSLYDLAVSAQVPGIDLDARIHNDRLLALCRAPSSPLPATATPSADPPPSSIDAAIALFHSLVQSKLANSYSLAILCDGLVKHGRVYRALELLDEWSLGTGPIPQPAFTSILAGLARLRDTQRAWQLFHRMQMHYTLPDEVTYSTMIALCAQSGQVERALSLFDQLRATPNQFPTTTTINALLLAMAKRKDYAPMAVDFFAQCLTAGFVPDAYSMAYLMQAARRLQDWESTGRGVWREAVDRGLVSAHVCTQALWTVSVDQVRTGNDWADDVRTVLAAATAGGDTSSASGAEGEVDDASLLTVDLANAYLATFFPHRGDQGLDYFFKRMPVKDGMSFRLALSYCMDDPAEVKQSDDDAQHLDLDPVSSFDKRMPAVYSEAAIARRARGIDVWAAWEAWYMGLLKACATHVAEVRARDSGAAPEHILAEAYLAKHTMSRPMLYKLVCTVVNGIAVDYPKKALALLLKYAKQYQFKLDKRDLPRLDWSVKRAGMLSRHHHGERGGADAELLQRQWEAILQVYGKKEGDLEHSLRRLKSKWNRVHK